MVKMFLGAALALTFAASGANAACFGGPAFATCSDMSGNSYTVNRFGNTTTLNGYNSSTGTQWNETVNRFGNTTSYQGQTNGHPWNMQENNFSGMRTYSGTNSQGQPFYYTCTMIGCN